MRIASIRAFEVIDSRAFPTIQTQVTLENGVTGEACVPSGASLGKTEVFELRDGDIGRWVGKGVLAAVRNVNEVIYPGLKGEEADIKKVDQMMCDLDGTVRKLRLGANAILSVSLATARAVANDNSIPLYSLISEISGTKTPTLPTPMVNILSGGLHAGGNLDFQDFLIVPLGARSFRQAMDFVGKIYHVTKQMLSERGSPTLLADEGGFGPRFKKQERALQFLCKAVQKSSLNAGVDSDVAIAVDVASSHFWQNDKYFLKVEDMELTSSEIVNFLEDWCSRYPIVSLEDGCAEEDWDGWAELTRRLSGKVQLIGDDLFTTNPLRIQRGINLGIANSVLIKLNQIGTLSESLDAIDLCKRNNYSVVISARSGETEDPFIADLAVGTAAGQIKIGSIARSERTAKYNRLLSIEQGAGQTFQFSGRNCFPFVN